MVHVLAELPRGMDSLLLFIAGVHDVDGISRVLAGTMTQSTLQRSKIKSRERSKSLGTYSSLYCYQFRLIASNLLTKYCIAIS
jgi:hypothetical protein